MKKVLLPACLLAAWPGVAPAEPIAWDQASPAARAALAATDGAPPAAIAAGPLRSDPAEIPGDGAGLPCVEYGRRTRIIPDFDPMHRACVSDALAAPGEFDAAWRVLLAKIRSGGGRLMPAPRDPIFGPTDELQQALGKGTLRQESLNESDHWGDAVYLQMKPAAESYRPTAVYAVSTRSYRIVDRRGTTLMATRADFSADGAGRLTSVQFWSGIKLIGAPAMAWTPGPTRMINDAQSLDGLWGRRWRQLVRSWAE